MLAVLWDARMKDTLYCNYSYVSCALGCPYEGYVAPEAVAKVSA